MFSEGTLNEIRSRSDIVECISGYVTLKKSGQGYVGLCPFHSEKTPSFHVQPVKQCFHCFGCHKGGNIFSFLSAIEGLSFPEVVERLAKRTGVPIEHERQRARPSVVKQPGTARLVEALEWATKYFHFLLMQGKEYEFARAYLKKRGISLETAEKFRLGVSPKGWTTLQDLMLKRGFSFSELVQAGLAIEKENRPGQGYDRFRQRLMFPILNLEGQVAGFGARLLVEEDNQPKYLNSPESPLFSKRRQLYGLFENQRGIRLRGEAILVEGYMDVVGLAQCGVNNAVAPMGTALTEEHGYQLKPFTQRIITVFDPDASGQDAWRRSVSLFLSLGVFAKDLSLPDGKDPDEFVLSQGAEAFYDLCERAPRQMTKLLKEIASQGPLSEEQRAKWLTELTPILLASRRLPDRALLWDDIALVLKTSVAALKEVAEGAMARKTPAELGPRNPRPGPKATQPTPRLDPLDFDFYQSALRGMDAFQRLPLESWVEALREPKIKFWLEKLARSVSPAEREQILEELVHVETHPKLLNIASAELFQSEKGEDRSAPLPLVIERLSRRKKEQAIKALSAQVKMTQRLGDEKEQMRLLEQLTALRSS